MNRDGFVVFAMMEQDGEPFISVETKTNMVGCGSCGVRAVGHGRSVTQIRDLPSGDRPVRLVWRKRKWICRDPAEIRGAAKPSAGDPMDRQIEVLADDPLLHLSEHCVVRASCRGGPVSVWSSNIEPSRSAHSAPMSGSSTRTALGLHSWGSPARGVKSREFGKPPLQLKWISDPIHI